MKTNDLCLLFIENLQDSGDNILRWLNLRKKNVVRISDFRGIEVTYDLENYEATFNANGMRFKWSEVSSIFYNVQSLRFSFRECSDDSLNRAIRMNIETEMQALIAHLTSYSPIKKVLGLSPFDRPKINKLNSLQVAKMCGLKVPDTAIVCSKRELRYFKQRWGSVVTKNIENGIQIFTSKVRITGQRTELITEELINQQNDVFQPSLIQREIEKLFEVRVFFLKKRLFSIAIFSQESDSTKVDFRNSKSEAEIRMVPFLLPSSIEESLCVLMKNLKLDMGSIDLIYSQNSEFIFIEVNPHGQFGFLSKVGNYYIEKLISECIVE